MPSGEIRVVQLCDFAAPYPASFVPGLEAIRERTEARGWQFEAVFAPGAEERAWYHEVREAGMCARISPELPRRKRPRWVAELLAEQSGPTILHTHFARWDVPAALVARTSRRGQPVAVVWHRHGMLSRDPLLLARDVARFRLGSLAIDAHLCVGPGGYAQVLRRGSRPRRTLLLPNPIDTSRFPIASEEDRAQARAELGIDPTIDLLVAFTWDWELKGGPLFVSLVRELVSRGRRVSALAVGGGQPAAADARRIGVEPHVSVVAPRADPQVFFAAASVFIAPGGHEGLGFAPLESVCCGTPVVASDIAGHRHYGSHLPAVNLTPLVPTAMADAVERELGVGGRDRAARVAASRDYLERHAGVEAWVERLLHVYEEALARRGALPARSNAG
jgi:glycosyltransferase involved in cell wall biosynthesis